MGEEKKERREEEGRKEEEEKKKSKVWNSCMEYLYGIYMCMEFL